MAARRLPTKKPAEEPEVLEAVGYVRVSTNEQAESGLGLEAQRARITAQALANGWKLVAIYEDAGVSAKTLDRPGLQAALKELRPGRVLLALKLDRLTRSVRDLYDLTAEVDKAGAEWASVMEKFDTTTATGRLMLNLIVQLSQWEREVIGERTSDALGTKKTRRERLGTTPLGYVTTTSEDGSRRVAPDAEGQKTVRLARQLRGEGHSLRQIAAELTRQGCPTKRGKPWRASSVSVLLPPRYLETLNL